MHDYFFDKGQSVLLVGEGNFCFSVELVKLNLNLKITSCSYEKHPIFSLTEENTVFLRNKGVRVLFGVDATQLNDCQEIIGCTFQRIVFNFPHVGGKSKIHLNQQLLGKFFSSCAALLSPEGSVIVSLCRGQGGTIRETKPRHNADTWQVVEMAAHGGFVLSAVEPWSEKSALGNYNCVGRRSRESSFHREGALVHIFRFAPNKLNFLSVVEYLNFLKPHQFQLPDGTLQCSYFEHILLKKFYHNEISSPIHQFLENFKAYCCNKHLKIKIYKQLPILSNTFTISHNTLMKSVYKLLEKIEDKNNSELQLHWGIVFKNYDHDFNLSPLSCYVLMTGPSSLSVCHEWVAELNCSSEALPDEIIKINSYATLIHFDELACNIFKLSRWNELWARGAKIITDKKGSLIWEPSSLSPPVFTFDISLKSEQKPNFGAICDVLWQLAGEFVQNVEDIDNYKSPEGWHSKCIRVTYCSYEIALHRSLVIKFQKEVIGEVLKHHLGLNLR